MLRVANLEYSMSRVVILRDDNDETSIAFWNERAPWTRAMKRVNGETMAYACRNFVCELPVTML